MTSAQLRAARGLINWTTRDLSERSGVHRNTVSAFESGKSESNAATIQALAAALEAAGVEFIAENGGGAGVRLRKRSEREGPVSEFRVGDYVKYREDVMTPDPKSIGLIGQIVDPGHKPPLPSHIYVRFPNGAESWVPKGSLLKTSVSGATIAPDDLNASNDE